MSCNYFDVLNRLVEKIEKQDLFSKFLDNKILINKIIKMLVYILKEYQRYPLSSIKKVYCHMPIDFDYFDYEIKRKRQKKQPIELIVHALKIT